MEFKFKHFVFLNAIDVLLTWYALTYMGLHEVNPILSPLLSIIGLIPALIATKLIGLIVIYILINCMPLKIKKLALNIICFMFVAVVLNNSYQMLIRVI